MQVLQIAFLISLIWLTALSLLVFYIFRHFRRLSKKIGTGNLITVIEKLIDLEEDNSKGLDLITKRIDNLKEDAFAHVQKVGLIRFNPFDEMGGDHSFSLTLLDGKDNGLILTGLHSRDRTRVYTKTIKNGKSDISLSKEEKIALNKALKQ